MSEEWISFHLIQFKSLVKDLSANLFAALTFEEKIPYMFRSLVLSYKHVRERVL